CFSFFRPLFFCPRPYILCRVVRRRFRFSTPSLVLLLLLLRSLSLPSCSFFASPIRMSLASGHAFLLPLLLATLLLSSLLPRPPLPRTLRFPPFPSFPCVCPLFLFLVFSFFFLLSSLPPLLALPCPTFLRPSSFRHTCRLSFLFFSPLLSSASSSSPAHCTSRMSPPIHPTRRNSTPAHRSSGLGLVSSPAVYPSRCRRNPTVLTDAFWHANFSRLLSFSLLLVCTLWLLVSSGFFCVLSSGTHNCP
ncbi:unnamed protein product, partial [Scytosiphon promiscuus]